MPINELDNPHRTGLSEWVLKLFTTALCFVVSVAVGFLTWRVAEAITGVETIKAPDFVHDYVYIFARAEWFAFLFGAKLHTRMVIRAIRFGPLTGKAVRASIGWPMLLTALVSLTCTMAYRYAFADIPYYLAPQVAQISVWLTWESGFDAFFKYVPGLPTTKEIERSF